MSYFFCLTVQIQVIPHYEKEMTLSWWDLFLFLHGKLVDEIYNVSKLMLSLGFLIRFFIWQSYSEESKEEFRDCSTQRHLAALPLQR